MFPQIFLEDKLSGKMKTVVLRSSDRVCVLISLVVVDVAYVGQRCGS